MNSVVGINATTQNITFGNKITKAQQEILNAIEKNQEKFTLERMRKEKPEEYRILMRNRMNQAILKATEEIFSPKNLIKTAFNVMTTNMAIGLGKFLGKCDKAINKILPKTKPNFVQNLSDKINTMKEYRQYKKYIMQTVKNGDRTREEAEVLIQNKWVALHYKQKPKNNTLIEIADDAQRLSKQHTEDL